MRQFKIKQNITHRDTENTDRYLKEIARESMITPEEEIELAQRIRLGDQAALEKLVKANLRFVVSVAKQYQNQWLSLPDLINEGNFGLIKAAHRFDETRGFKFISYAVRWIRQAILQSLIENSRTIRLPSNKILELSKIHKKQEQLEQKYGRNVSTHEIAEALKMEVAKIEEVLGFYDNTLSIDKKTHADAETTMEDMLPHPGKSTDHQLILHSTKEDIQRALTKLSSIEKAVLVDYFWLENEKNLTLEEIGEKLNLTRERVRQIRNAAIKRLQRVAGDHLKKHL